MQRFLRRLDPLSHDARPFKYLHQPLNGQRCFANDESLAELLFKLIKQHRGDDRLAETHSMRKNASTSCFYSELAGSCLEGIGPLPMLGSIVFPGGNLGEDVLDNLMAAFELNGVQTVQPVNLF